MGYLAKYSKMHPYAIVPLQELIADAWVCSLTVLPAVIKTAGF